METPKNVWRVSRKPRFTVLDIGEYMSADDGPRETIVRRMKYERVAQTTLYRTLNQSIASYLASPTRDHRILANARENLEMERTNSTNAYRIDNLTYELRALEVFERSLNALQVGGLNLERVGRTEPLMIEGVRVSVYPTVHVRVSRSRGANLFGALVVDAAKGILPKTQEAQAKLTRGMLHSGNCSPPD